MLVEVLSAALELVTDEADAIEINSHGKLLIFFLHLVIPRTLLAERLMVHGKSEHDVRADFPGVQGAVEATKLNGMVAVEETVQIEEVVATVVIMGFPHSTVALIPNALNLREVFRLDGVHSFDQVGIHLFAVAHPCRSDLQGFVKQIIAAGNEIDKVADAPWGMVGSIKMDVDATG